MNNDPKLVPRDALAGQRIAISVSESSDLCRLGLGVMHLRVAIAELSRAIVIAGGIVVYGGRIDYGFTKIVLDEAEKYGSDSGSFEHYVPYTEHEGLTAEELTGYAASLGVKSTVLLLDAGGVARSIADCQTSDFDRAEVEPAVALTAMRTLTADVSAARVVVGGKVVGFLGSMPGVAEEAASSLRAGKPLYVAGGFGGAATLVGSLLTPGLYDWLPPGLPAGLTEDVREQVARQLESPPSGNGLDADEQAILAATNRPSDIASLVVLGLSRCVGSDDGAE